MTSTNPEIKRLLGTDGKFGEWHRPHQRLGGPHHQGRGQLRRDLRPQRRHRLAARHRPRREQALEQGRPPVRHAHPLTAHAVPATGRAPPLCQSRVTGREGLVHRGGTSSRTARRHRHSGRPGAIRAASSLTSPDPCTRTGGPKGHQSPGPTSPPREACLRGRGFAIQRRSRAEGAVRSTYSRGNMTDASLRGGSPPVAGRDRSQGPIPGSAGAARLFLIWMAWSIIANAQANLARQASLPDSASSTIPPASASRRR